MKAKNMKEWHKLVIEKDSYICQVCGEYSGYDMCFDEKGQNQYLAGHHVLSKGSHPELKLEVSNGRAIHSNCHEKLHRGQVKLKKVCEFV